MMLIYFQISLVLIFLLAVIALLLKVRIRLKINRSERALFLGLGRSGVELDFYNRVAFIKIFGSKLRSFSIEKKDKQKNIRGEVSKKHIKKKQDKGRKHPKLNKPGVVFESLQITSDSIKPIWRYIVSVFKCARVEEAEGEIAGGFDSPDQTGQAFGYFQAAQSALPSVLGRIKYKPDWDGSSLDGFLKLSIAMPAYKLVAETILLLVRLPVMKIWKLAIAK